MKKLLTLIVLIPLLAVGNGQIINTGNHRALFSGGYTTPTFVTYYSNTTNSSSTTVKTSSAITLTAGDFVRVLCSGANNAPPYAVSSSPSNTFATTGTINNASPGSLSGFFAFGVGAGSTTFTCTSAVSIPYQGITVLQYHPGSVTAYDGSFMNHIVAQNLTSGSLTTSAKGLLTTCGHPNFAVSSITAGSIGADSATLRNIVSDADYCEDTVPTTSQSSITGGITSTGGSSPSWDGEIASFIPGTFWTQPTFNMACDNTPSASSTTTVTCTIASPTAGDYYVGYCRSNSGATSLVLTSSPSNTFTGVGFQTTGSAGVSEAYYSTSAASGSTTFTCTANSSVAYQGINVLAYHPGSLTGIDISNHNGITSSTNTWTSSTFSTTAKGLVVSCADPLFGVGGWGLTNSSVGQYTPESRINTSFILCSDSMTGSPLASITATAQNSSAGQWQGAVVAFK